MAEKPAVAITSGLKERIPQATDLLAQAFLDDPAIRYMLCTLTEEQRRAYMHSYIKTLMTAAGLNKGVFHEANGWSSCAVWMPPRRRVDNFWTLPRCGMFKVLWTIGLPGVKRMLIEFQPKSDAAKKKGLKGQKDYWYLFFIGTLKEKRGQGLGDALIKHFQAIAAKEQLPIWLEATTENSVRLYQRNGFELIDTIVLGKGVADADGYQKKGGDGVHIWALLWEPGKKPLAN